VLIPVRFVPDQATRQNRARTGCLPGWRRWAGEEVAEVVKGFSRRKPPSARSGFVPHPKANGHGHW